MKLAEFLEREGGHVFVLIMLVLIFTVFGWLTPGDSPFFKEIALVGFGAALGALTMSMKGSGTGKNNTTPAVPPPAPQPQPEIKS